MKKKIETAQPQHTIPQAETPNALSDDRAESSNGSDGVIPSSNIAPAGLESVLDHIQRQDSKINELEGTIKDLLTYLQKQQGVNTNPDQPQQQQGQQGGGTLDTIGGILQTVMKSQGQSDTPSIESQLAGMQIENMRLMNQYITKRLIGDVQETPVQHATVS